MNPTQRTNMTSVNQTTQQSAYTTQNQTTTTTTQGLSRASVSIDFYKK